MGLDYYYNLRSSPCRGPMMTAKALGVELDLKEINLLEKGQLKPEFVALNPQHTVPTLVDGDFVLWESKAIIGYLVAKYGKDDSLYPNDPKRRAAVDRQLYYDMALYQKFRDYAYPVMRLGKSPDPAALVKFQEFLSTLDKELGATGNKFVTGSSICVADHTLASAMCSFKSLGISLEQHPHVEAWLKRCEGSMPGYTEICVTGGKLFGDAFRSKFQ